MNAPDRREFVLAAAGLALARLAAAQPGKPENLGATVDAMLEAVRSQYGNYLDLDQLDQVRRGLLHSQLAARKMAQIKLQNGDEPAFVFSAEVLD